MRHIAIGWVVLSNEKDEREAQVGRGGNGGSGEGEERQAGAV